MECGVRLEAKLQLLFVWMWKCNTAALAHTETRRSFLEEKRPFAVEIYNLPLLFTQRENRKECIYGSSVGRYGVLVTYNKRIQWEGPPGEAAFWETFQVKM